MQITQYQITFNVTRVRLPELKLWIVVSTPFRIILKLGLERLVFISETPIPTWYSLLIFILYSGPLLVLR